MIELTIWKTPLRRILSLVTLCTALCSLVIPVRGLAQTSADTALEKMPADLEQDFALSALPPYLRAAATVYLLDPAKGYYIARQGTNGFVCFISRTEWEWGEFRKDLVTPMSYDPEGARTVFPIYLDVAAMRASGKFTALQVRDSVIARIHNGFYKVPSRAGISYMLAPIMRAYRSDPDDKTIWTISVPHYMFYAPYVTNADIGGDMSFSGPFVGNPDDLIFGKGKGPYGYIILTAGKAEKAKIVDENADLLKRLAAYKPYLTVDPGAMHHHS